MHKDKNEPARKPQRELAKNNAPVPNDREYAEDATANKSKLIWQKIKFFIFKCLKTLK